MSDRYAGIVLAWGMLAVTLLVIGLVKLLF